MKILIITNLENDCSEEDIWIAKSFEKDGHYVLLENKYFSPKLDSMFDIFIKRYSWIEDINQFSVGGSESDYETRIVQKNLPRINFDGKFDNQGKHYLSRLYAKGYPVVPTISSLNDLQKLSEYDTFLLKPVNGYSGFGIIEVSADKVISLWNEDYVIQPKIKFDSEVQFYFIGSKFQFAQIFKPKKLNSHENALRYHPSKMEISIASVFANLNGTNFNGVQRIDFLKNGNQLLLSELEDDSPYMAIESLSENEREKFINNFKQMTYEYMKNLHREDEDQTSI